MLEHYLRRAAENLTGLPPAPLRGDTHYPENPIPAAVLIAVTREDVPHIILTQRPTHMRNHAGQIAFPGGRIDAEDSDPTAAALREAQEEIGLDPVAAHIIGSTDIYHTSTGYVITPIIAIIPPNLVFTAHPGEVADIFAAPLAALIDPAQQVMKSAEINGLQRQFYEISWQNRSIWGATAGMLVNLGARLR